VTALAGLGNIPSEWEAVPARRFLMLRKEAARSGDSIVTAFRDGTVTLRKNRRTDGYTEALKEHGYQHVRTGDLVVHSMDGFAGAIGVSDSDGKMSPVANIYLADGDARYFAYTLRVLAWGGLVTALAKGIRERSTSFDAPTIASLVLPRPSVDEQRRIADFLDDRVTRIDQIITARQAQLAAARELYEAQRDNLLSKTEVKVRELRRLRCLVQTGPFGSQLHSDEYVDNGWPVVNPAGISGGGIRAISGMAVDDDVRDRLSRHILRLGDIVFGRRGEMGRAGLVTQSEVGWVCGTGSLLVRLTDPAAEPAYITELLSTMEVRRYFQRQSVGSTMDNLNTEILLAVPLRIPSVQQQRATLAEIAGLAENAEEARRLLDGSISTLAEYKQSLITAAVTGGFDVTTAGSAVRG